MPRSDITSKTTLRPLVTSPAMRAPAAPLPPETEIADALPALIAVLDMERRYCYCNSSYESWFGMSPAELLGRRFEDVMGDDVFQTAGPHIQKALEGHDVNFEDIFAYRRGQTRHVNVHYTPQRDSSGKVTGYVSLTIDVSRQRDAENRLRELTQHLETKVIERTCELNQTIEALQATIEGAPDTMVIMDANGVIINANSAAERLFGVPANTLVGQHLKTFLPAADVDDFHEFFEESKNASPDIRSTKPRQSRLRHVSGIHIPIEAAIGVSPRLDHYTAFIRDISARRSLESELLHVAVDERHHIAQDLHDGLCQEISAVHFALSGLAQRLAAKHSTEAPHARKLAQMIEETLDHGRQIAHGLSPVMEEGDDLVRALMRLMRNTEEICGLKCHVQAAAGFRGVNRDIGTQLYYIAQEALNNVLRHARAGRIDVELSSNAEEVVLRVKDDGCGLHSLAESTGRGVRFMRYRATAINGTLRLRNRPAGGTELECCVPAAASATSGTNEIRL